MFEGCDIAVCTCVLQRNTESIEGVGKDKGWERGSPRSNSVTGDLGDRACGRCLNMSGVCIACRVLAYDHDLKTTSAIYGKGETP